MLTIRTRRQLRRAIAGTSAIALATALAAGPAQAQTQSYNAPDPTIASGNVTINRATSGLEIYDINSATAVLDFTPSDTTGTGTINFQNAGTTVIYQGTSDFTVLNRILPSNPSRPIQFDGTVRSQIISGVSAPGGSVWFYSPGGIILGGSAVFDVGSLLLATGDPTAGTGSIDSTTSFSIGSASGSPAIAIQPGAQINATPEGSYVALVAPVVNQGGNVRVNGSAAYVAAESATLSISQGLFDIAVTIGADGGNGVPLTHGGTTGGPASNGFGDNHGIYMVAVPKNTAITMMIAPSGQLGFDVASSASIENGAIYLQAGGNLQVNPFDPVETRIQDLPTSALDASIQLSPGTISSTLVAQSTASTIMTTNGSNPLVLKGPAYLYGGKDAQIGALSGGTFTAEDRVVVNSFGALPGQATVFAQASASMDFQGALDIFASSYPLRSFPIGFDATRGGAARLDAAGGAISATQVRINAAGIGSSAGGNTFGGDSQMVASAGGSITLSGSATLIATASAFNPGSTGTGGTARFSIDGGSIDIAGNADADATALASDGASGVGGLAQIFAGTSGGGIDVVGSTTLLADAIAFSVNTGNGGTATGGTVAIDLLAPTGTFQTSINLADLSATATASGGSAFAGTGSGGAAIGGMARIAVNAGTSLTAGNVALSSFSSGGNGAIGAVGGNATAGTARLSATGGTVTVQNLDLDAAAVAGSGGFGLSSLAGGAGGQALAGGGASIYADGGGTITATTTQLDTYALGGSGGDGFNDVGPAGSGGSATASVAAISTNGAGQITLGDTIIDASASGGYAGFGVAQAGGSGGTAQGGNANVSAGVGTIQLATLSVRSDADGGFGSADGSKGGDATAGKALASADNGGTLTISGSSLFLSAQGFGGSASGSTSGSATSGGFGKGGVAELVATAGGTIDSFASFVSLDASGDGGSASGSGLSAGALGQGGHARVSANAGVITLRGDVEAIADGFGGYGTGSSNGGTGIGGEARLGTFGAASTSKVDVLGDLFLEASGTGGFGDAGRGGDGLGGAPADSINGPFDAGTYLIAIGGTVSVTGTIALEARGSGGTGDTGGGTGRGGFVSLSAFGGDISAPGIVDIDVSGTGGDGLINGSAGGAGFGGLSNTYAAAGAYGVPIGVPSSTTIGSLFVDVSGSGGSGGSGGDGALGGAGGLGGDGTGGRALVLAEASGGPLQIGNQLIIFAQGAGGDGGLGGSASSSGGTGGAGGKGGVGTGGITNFGTASGPAGSTNNGSATFDSVIAIADGLGGAGGDGVDGGNGGDGGAGIGGSASLLSRGTPVTILGGVSIDGSAFGGDGGAGAVDGAGGAAEGGSAGVLVTNRFQRSERGSLTAATISATAGAYGGFGSSIGATTAGQAIAQVTNADATLVSLSLATFGDNPPPAGSESSVTVDGGTLIASDLSASVTGDLSFGVVNGGTLDVGSLFLDATGSLRPFTGGSAGTISIASDFFAGFGGDFVTTSDFSVAGLFSVSAGGQLQLGAVNAAGDIDLSSDGGVVTGDLTSGSQVLVTSLGAVTTGAINAGDSVFILGGGNVATGDITAALGGSSLVFGDVEIGSAGSINVGAVRAATIDIFSDLSASPPFGTIQTGALTAETISVSGAGDVSTGDLASGDFYSGIDTSGDNYLIGVAAGGNLSVGNVNAFTSIGLAAETGSITAGTITAGGSALLLAKTDVTAAGITTGSASTNNVFISNIGVLATDPVFSGFQTLEDFAFFDPATLSGATPTRLDGRIAISGSISTGGLAAAAQGGIQIGAITAPHRLLLDSGAGLTLGALSTNAALNLISSSSIGLGNISASSVDLRSTQAVSTGAITASGAVNVTAGTTATFTGLVSAPQISVTSQDLQLSGAGALGTAGTTLLSLNAPGVSSFTFGGTGGTGYSIDAVEAQGLRAQRIDITTSAPVTIGSVTLNGSAASGTANLAGSGGRLTIDSSSGIRVVGPLTIANAATGNRLTLRSGGGIAVATDSGGAIAMTGAGAGTLGGTLELVGTTIAVATGSLVDQIAANPNFAGRNQALSTPPSGTARPAGDLQANRIELDASRLIAIQNSGTATQAAGFTAGAGGMEVRSRGSAAAPLDLFAFGRIADGSGGFKANRDTLSAITFTGAQGTFARAAAVNNCVVGGTTCDAAPSAPPAQEAIIDRIPAALQNVVEGALSSISDPESIASLPVVRIVSAVDTGALRTEPVISDPVSGGGNPSLWEAASDQDDRREGGDRPAAGQGEGK